MTPTTVNEQIPVPPPACHREQARLGPALHIDALTLVTTLHLLALCRFTIHLAHRRCPPFTSRSRWRTSNIPRRILVAHCTLTHAVAALLCRYARLVARVACPRARLRFASGQRWPTPHP